MRRVVLRAELELRLHEAASVVTLTYSDEFVGDGQVRKAEWKKVKERLYCAYRRDTGVKLRFHGIGEYGGRNGRPHWHVVAFGLPVEVAQSYWEKAWTDPVTGRSMGRIQVDKVDLAVLRYVAGYCMEKLTLAGDPRLEGREPEFVIRPNRPGLGLGMVDEIVEELMSNPAALAVVLSQGDVPAQMRLGHGMQAVDKLFKQKLRVGVLGEVGADLARQAHKANYLAECAAGVKEFGRAWALGGPAVARQRVANRVGRVKIFASQRHL